MRHSIINFAPRLQDIQRHLHTAIQPLEFRVSDQLWGMPMKKRKKIDPTILIARETRKRKRLEKEMKRLDRLGRILKPIEEIDGDRSIRNQMELRKREGTAVGFDEMEERVLAHKQWTRWKFKEHAKEMKNFSQIMDAQQCALDELKFESEELFKMAIQVDDGLIPMEIKCVTETPPIKGYEGVDGQYTDVSKTFE